MFAAMVDLLDDDDDEEDEDNKSFIRLAKASVESRCPMGSAPYSTGENVRFVLVENEVVDDDDDDICDSRNDGRILRPADEMDMIVSPPSSTVTAMDVGTAEAAAAK